MPFFTSHSPLSGLDESPFETASRLERLLQFLEPLLLLVRHPFDAEIDGLGVEGGGVDAEEPVDETLGGKIAPPR